MTRRTIKRGSGITAKEYMQADGADLPVAMREFFANWKEVSKDRDAFGARVVRAEEWARAVLAQAGIEGKTVPDSPKDYALRLLDEIAWIRAFIERGEAAEAARFAVNLGILMQEAAFKFQWEHSALVGAAQAHHALNAAAAKSATADKRTQKIAGWWNEAIAEHPSRSADDIEQHVRAKAHVSESTMERHLARARKLGLIPLRHRRAR